MTRPNDVSDCPICQRVENTIKADPVLCKKLSDNELQVLVQNVQKAVLNNETINERGVNMTNNEEKYVITKATFQDFYETQDVLVSIIQKMANRIEKQDQVLMKYGAALSEIIAKDMEMGGGYPPQLQEGLSGEPSLGEDLREEEADVLHDENELGEDEEQLEGDEELLSESKEEEPMLGEPSVPGMPGEVPAKQPMAPIAMAAEKSAFEAGYKAALAEMKKQTGVPVAPADFKNAPSRGVTAMDQTQSNGQNGSQPLQKSLMEEDMSVLGTMSASEAIKRLKEEGRFK